MKKMKLNNTLVTLCLVLIMTILAFDYGAKYGARTVVSKTDTVTVSDTLYKYDTLTIDRPVPKVVEKIKIDTVYDHNGNEIPLVTETKHYQDTIIQQKDTAIVRAQVTGINAELDTVSVMFNRREITNTVEITKYLEKPKTLLDRIHIQPQVTSGYDLINKKWGITAGIGVGIEL